jgi:transcriptional repressor of cell division inhibition gene dicB
MNMDEVLTYFKNKNQIAKALKIQRQSVQKWGDKVPAKRQIQLQIITNGELKANRHDVMSA